MTQTLTHDDVFKQVCRALDSLTAAKNASGKRRGLIIAEVHGNLDALARNLAADARIAESRRRQSTGMTDEQHRRSLEIALRCIDDAHYELLRHKAPARLETAVQKTDRAKWVVDDLLNGIPTHTP